MMSLTQLTLFVFAVYTTAYFSITTIYSVTFFYIDFTGYFIVVSRRRLMAYCALLLLTLTVGKAVAEECSNQQPGGSGVLDLQQVTTIPYCFIDECTIKRNDTGQQLDIIYITDSVLVVTPTGNQTSMVIAKNEDQCPCMTMVADDQTAEFVELVTIGTSIAVVSGYIFVVHLLYKELHNVFGKLLMLYNGALCLQCVVAVTLMITHFRIPTNSQFICQFIFFLCMQGDMAMEVFATCILAYLAYIVYLSDRFQQHSLSRDKRFFRYSLTYSISLLILFGSFILARDLQTGNGRYTILPTGHCSYWASDYDTILIPRTNAVVNKMIQIALFIVYLCYYYKFSTSITEVSEAAKKQNRALFKIAISIGGIIGISEFIFLLEVFFAVDYIGGTVAATLLSIQQCVIMTSFLYYKRMTKLCRDVFNKDTSP